MQDKVAIVTGAGAGIGEAIARRLALRGAKVVVADINADGASRVAADIGEAARPFVADVSDPVAAQAIVDFAVSSFGALHIGVNNAGIGGDQMPIADLPVDVWRSVLSVNLDGVFYCMRAQIPAMIASGGGSIVNMSSILGSVGFAGASAYVASKHGVVGLTRTAAIEYGQQGIRINAIAPGFIRTPLGTDALTPEALQAMLATVPQARLGEPEEVAALVAFLASDDASNITGSYYTTDGGYTAR
jgi:NAD(P)-dependent dehydrogenase (short-subunit alcohol dehydrogenase family)